MLFPQTASRNHFCRDTKSFTSCDFTLVNTTLVTDSFFPTGLSHSLSSCDTDLFTPIRNCSVNTELTHRMNDSEQEFCVRSIRIEVLVSLPFFLLQDPTTQSTDTLEYWMTSIFESLHHLGGCRVPFSFRCVRKSSTPLPQSPGPRNVQCPCENFF